MTSSGLPTTSPPALQHTRQDDRSRGSRWPMVAAGILGSIAVAIPIALLQHVAHDVAISQGRQVGRGVYLIGMGLLGLLFMGLCALALRRVNRAQRQRLQRARPVRATVIAIEPQGVKGDLAYREVPTLRYEREDGVVMEERAAVHRLRVAVGDEIDARYDPQEPSWIAIPRGWDRDRWGIIAFVVGLAGL